MSWVKIIFYGRFLTQLFPSRNPPVFFFNDESETHHTLFFIHRIFLFDMQIFVQDLVLLLLQYNAAVNITNAEGRFAKDVAKADSDILKILSAAQAADAKKREERLLTAARENDLATINLLVRFFLFR